jgi:tetratricopeptide (TPR) repeat protein
MMSALNRAAILPLLGLLIGGHLAAQSVSFAQLNDLALLQVPRKQTKSEWLDAQYALVWAVEEMNRSVRSGKKLDFIVITGGFGVGDGDPASVAQLIPELVRALSAAMVPAVYVLPGEDDLDAASGMGKKSYEDFVAHLKRALQDKEVRDLATDSPAVSGMQIVGLDSASFGNDGGKLAQSNRPAQLREMDRLRRVVAGRPSIVFAPIPDLDDPTLLKRGKAAVASWQVDGSVRLAWNSLVEQAEILAVFSGHLHSSTRGVYSRDYSWALNQPGPTAALKTWVCPPLTAPALGPEPLLRGFWIATVTRDRQVSVATNWFPPAALGTEPPDKSDKLAEGRAYEKNEDYDKAAAAYQQALSSKDDWVRGQAEAGFGRTLKQAKARTWEGTLLAQFWLRWWRDIAIGFAIVLLLTLAARPAVWRRLLKVKAIRAVLVTSRITIAPPQKGNEGAPTEEFTVQLALALADIRSALGLDRGWGLLGGAGVKVAGAGSEEGAEFPGPRATPPGTGGSLPVLKIGGLEIGSVLAWLAAARDLVGRRIEIQVWGTPARTQAIAFKYYFGRIEETHWVTPPPGSSADVVEAARQLAYCIMGQEYIR